MKNIPRISDVHRSVKYMRIPLNRDFNFLPRIYFKHIAECRLPRPKMSLSSLVKVALQWKINLTSGHLASCFLQKRSLHSENSNYSQKSLRVSSAWIALHLVYNPCFYSLEIYVFLEGEVGELQNIYIFFLIFIVH